MLPQLAKGEANKVFVIPSEWSQALSGLSNALGRVGAPHPDAVEGEIAAARPPAAQPENGDPLDGRQG
jgi:hypothetical protein